MGTKRKERKLFLGWRSQKAAEVRKHSDCSGGPREPRGGGTGL